MVTSLEEFREKKDKPLKIGWNNSGPMRRERGRPVEITPMVFFVKGEFGNVTYVTCNADSFDELDEASELFESYVNRFNGEIMTNFVQQRPTFQDAPFSLQNIMGGRLDESQLRKLHISNAEIICQNIQKMHVEEVNMTRILVKLADGTIIHCDIVVANLIKYSFNKAASAEISGDLKELLKNLALAVGKMSESLPKDVAEQAARDLSMLTDESTSKAPRKEWWQLCVEGLKKAATYAGEIGKPVLEILRLIVPMLT